MSKSEAGWFNPYMRSKRDHREEEMKQIVNSVLSAFRTIRRGSLASLQHSPMVELEDRALSEIAGGDGDGEGDIAGPRGGWRAIAFAMI